MTPNSGRATESRRTRQGARSDVLVTPPLSTPRAGLTFLMVFVLLAVGMVTAALGFVALMEWVFGRPLLTRFGADLMPMAPSTAVLFLMFGSAIGLCARTPLSARIFWISAMLGCLGTLAALLLFTLNGLGIYWSVDPVGLAIPGLAGPSLRGHMPPLTALCFLLAGSSFLASLAQAAIPTWRTTLALGTASVLSGLCMILSLGYIGSTPLLNTGTFIPPALNTVLIFVIMSFALLVLASRSVGLFRKVSGSDSRAGFVFFLIFLLVAEGLVIGGWFYYRNNEQHHLTEVKRNLSSIAELKVGELVRWRKERMADGSIFFQNETFSRLVRQAFSHPADGVAERELRSWLERVRTGCQYSQVSLLDAQSVARLSVPNDPEPSCSETLRMASEVLRSGQIAFQDFNRHTNDPNIYLAVLVPILDASDANRPLGVLMLRIDPNTYLYPFIQHWPAFSETAETLLVRREINEVVFLNDLRFRTNAALNLRAPLDRTTMPAVQAALGREGIMEGIDYRGKPVVAALRTIPDSPWALVARIDTEEVSSPMRDRLWQIVIMIAISIFSAGTGVGLVWRQQRVRFYRDRAVVSEALRDSENLLRESQIIANLGSYVLDMRTGLWTSSAVLDKVFGIDRGYERSVEGWTALIHPDDRTMMVDYFAKEVKGKGRNFDKEYRIIRHDDQSERWVHGMGRLEFDAQGQPVRRLGTIQDITERKRVEGKIRNLNVTLEQRVVRRTAELEAANQELEAFSYSVSHDLRAPLRHVHGYVDLLAQEAEGRLSDKGRHYMKTIAAASEEMGELIDDLLAFSRMGRAEMIETSINLNSLVRDTLRDLEEPTRGRNMVWTLPPLPAVQGDPAMLKLVLANLLGNAVKFTRSRDPAVIEIGIVEEEVRGQRSASFTQAAAATEVREKDERQQALFTDHGSRITFFVRDNGVGFDPQYAHKLFGVFQRLHRADEFEGTGIGLANVRRIIVRHGGRTWAEGHLNEGATFYFTLKKAKE